MPFDPTTIAPAQRARLVRVGTQFGSRDTLEQANLTLNAFDAHGAALGAFGFEPSDRAQLVDARDALVEAGVEREDARSDRKVTNGALLDAVFAGKSARLSAHATLSNARRRLALGGADAAARTIDAVLHQTRTSGASAEELAVQLDQLRTVLSLPEVAGAASAASALATELGARAAAMRGAAVAADRPLGTRAETEQIDLIDGYVVELVRAARKASRAAARELGQPALADAFELTGLYGSSARRPAKPAPAQE